MFDALNRPLKPSEEELHGWYPTALVTDPLWAEVVVIWHGLRISVNANVEKLGTDQGSLSPLARHLKNLLKARYKKGDTRDLLVWMLGPCLPQVLHLLPPAERDRQQTLEEYFYARTLHFELQNIDGQLAAVQGPDCPARRNYDFPSMPVTAEAVVAALREEIPCFRPEQLLLVRDESLPDHLYYEGPTLVRLTDGNEQTYWFKGVRRSQFARELDILRKLRHMSPEGLYVSKLVGLVQWTQESAIAGMLLEHIPGDTPLYIAGPEDTTLEQRTTWIQQVRQTIRQLHAADIIWGDACSANVLIDERDGRARVIDFGGGYHDGFVKKKRAETKAGDWEGLRAIAAEAGVELLDLQSESDDAAGLPNPGSDTESTDQESDSPLSGLSSDEDDTELTEEVGDHAAALVNKGSPAAAC